MLQRLRGLRRAALPACMAVGLALVMPSCIPTEYLRGYPTDGTSYLGPDGTIIGPGGRTQGRYGAGLQLRPAEPQWRWEGDGVTGSPSMVIDLGNQTATFYKGRTAVGWAPISSGDSEHSTPSGSFTVQQKNANHVSNLYGDYVDSAGNVVVANIGIETDRRPPGTHFKGASMPYFMRINRGIGMHAGYLPGYPASHGCIRLPRGAAEIFYRNAHVGMPVSVVH